MDVGLWPVFFLFSLKTFRQGRRICNQRAAEAIFGWKFDLRGVLIEKAISILERKLFGLFGDIFSAGSLELIFKCPEDHIEEKKVLSRIFNWLTTFGVWAKNFCISDLNLPSGLSKLKSMCQWIFFQETKDFEKIYIITIIFGFQTEIFQVWVKKFPASLSVLHSICLEKYFKRINCGKQTLSHCFFLDFYAFHFFVNLRRFLLAVLSELNSTFPQDCLHGKPFLWKKNILNCISLCRRKYFVFMAKRFLHAGSELLSLCPVDHSMKKKFLKNLVFLHEEIHWNFLEIRSKNF